MNGVAYSGDTLLPVFARYMDEEGNPTRPALQVYSGQDGSPWATVTVNLPNDELSEGEVFIKDWAENEPLVEALTAAGWLEPTGRRVPTGYTTAGVFRFAGPLLAEYEQWLEGEGPSS